MSGGGGGGNTNTIQQADPWSGIQPSLSALYGNLTGAYNAGQLNPYQNTGQVAPWSPAMNAGYATAMGGANQASALTSQLAGGNFSNNVGGQVLSGIAQGNTAGDQSLGQMLNGNISQLAGGNFTSNPAASTLAQTANGNFLNANNPQVQGLLAAEAQPVTQQFTNSVMPGIMSAFASGGRLGSDANMNALQMASNSLGTTLNNLAQSTIGQNYMNERNNQLSAANQLLGTQTSAGNLLNTAATGLNYGQQQAGNSLANLQGSALSSLPTMSSAPMTAASTQQDYLQNILNSQIAQQNYVNQMPLMGLENLSGLLQNGMTLTGSTSSGTSNINSNPFGSAIGGAALGAGIGSIIPGVGTAIGAGLGGLGGLLSGIF